MPSKKKGWKKGGGWEKREGWEKSSKRRSNKEGWKRASQIQGGWKEHGTVGIRGGGRKQVKKKKRWRERWAGESNRKEKAVE